MNLNDQIKGKRLSWHKLEIMFFEWLVLKKYAVFTLVIFSTLLLIFSYLPYINLFIDKFLIVFLLFTAALIIFKVSVKKIVIFILVLFLFSLPLVLLRRYEAAETLINFAYGVLFVVVIKFVKESFSN